MRRIERGMETRVEGFATAREKKKRNGAKEARGTAVRRGKEIRKEPYEIKRRGGSLLLYRAVNEK